MWDLEIVTSTERLNQQLMELKRHWPLLDLCTKSRFFAVFGCELPRPLLDSEKSYLEQMMTPQAEPLRILRYRYGKQ